jgi:hypothetical protein
MMFNVLKGYVKSTIFGNIWGILYLHDLDLKRVGIHIQPFRHVVELRRWGVYPH